MDTNCCYSTLIVLLMFQCTTVSGSYIVVWCSVHTLNLSTFYFPSAKFGSCVMRDLIRANLDLQSVDNEIVLWEPKTKEQSPGEVTQFDIS